MLDDQALVGAVQQDVGLLAAIVQPDADAAVGAPQHLPQCLVGVAAAGAWCGWQTLPMILLIASLGGIGYAIVSQLLQRRTITTIAFGPWLALGSMINLGYLAWISY